MVRRRRGRVENARGTPRSRVRTSVENMIDFSYKRESKKEKTKGKEKEWRKKEEI